MATLVAIVIALVARPAEAQTFAKDRNELIVVPALGGNSDIGVQFGAATTIAHFRDGYYPYRWRVDASSAVSVKDDSRGFRLVQQLHEAKIDVPGFLVPGLRLTVRPSFLRAIDYTWYGLGNHTSPAEAGGRANRYIEKNGRFSSLARFRTGTPFDAVVASHTRYEMPSVYRGSKLAEDVASGTVVGAHESLLETVAAGVYWDTRDDEFVPRRGVFYQLGAAMTVGTADQVRFGELSAVLQHYAPLGKMVTFASRMIGSYKVGTIPFYELQTGGVFDPLILDGGARGLRGIPQGRYAGPLKVIANTELRATPLPRFRILGWMVHVGVNAFFDAGRVFGAGDDGRRLGLAHAVGGGMFFQWDQSAVFRVEAAWAPGAGLPTAFYFEDGLLF